MDNKKTILIAEDEKAYRTVLQNKLQSAGVNILLAENGEQALKVINDSKPDLIMLDLIMPIKDGFEVLREIKENNLAADMKIVVLSNLGQAEDIDKAKNLGAIDYIIKTETDLSDAVKKILTYLET